jgi:inosine-uridine nucleoside N-ribohydrolase
MKSTLGVDSLIVTLSVFSWIVLIVADPSSREDSVGALHTTTIQAQKVIIDCDPAGMIATGLDVDDDLALLNAFSMHRQGVIDLLGISVTGGNAPIDYTFPNALELTRRRAGISDTEIEIHRGGEPLTKAHSDRDKNDSAMGPSSSDATTFLIESIMNSPPGTITILCLGPLTNIAAAYAIEPRIADRVQRIVSMGGTLTPGLPYDLNIRTDPVAAAIVWNEMNCPKIIIPVETCIQAVFGPSQLMRVQDYCDTNARTAGNTMGPAIVCSFLFRLKAQRRIMPLAVNWRYSTVQGNKSSQRISEGFIIWDLVALWAAIRPELYDKWTYFDATVLPAQPIGFLGAKGPKILLGGSAPWKGGSTFALETEGSSSPQETYRNRILAPLLLKNESDLHELIFEHLFVREEVSTMVQKPILNLHERLGSLPKLMAMLLSMALGFIFIVRIGAFWLRQ